MATNDFLPFASGGSANVLTQAQWAAYTSLLNGFQAGVAQSNAMNKAFRQSSIMAAVLAQFIADQTGANSVDDGTTATLLANLKAGTAGRVLRRLVYTNVAGTQYVSINGGTPTTTGASTYVPSSTMTTAIAKVQGGGGGGGGTATTSSGAAATGSGGASGSLGVAFLTGANIGASQTVTVGAAGAFGGVNGSGGNGGTSSLGSLVTAPGGGGGTVGLASAPPYLQVGGVPAAAATFGGSVTPILSTGGNAGIVGACSSLANGALSGAGGNSPLTGGGGGAAVLANTIGKPATSAGAGGGGGAVGSTQAGTTGGIGGAGCVIIEEYA